jgi:hypothetical protein
VTLSNRHFLVVLGISSPMGVGEYLHNIYIIIYIYTHSFLGMFIMVPGAIFACCCLILRGTLCALEGSQI